MDAKALIENFSDFLALNLDTYEQAVYLYVIRHTRLQGLEEAVIGFKSARRKMAMGIGEKGKPMSENTCYEKPRSLQVKGCVEILSTEQGGTRLRVRLPEEIPGVAPPREQRKELTIDELDFFLLPENRVAILRREQGRCFYCLRAITPTNYSIEHVLSRPNGSNHYWNVVAACRSCNNRKGATSALDYVRLLYRDGLLTPEDFGARRAALEALQRRELKPILGKR
ncbi:MAG: HNH endonuclease [Chloroflexi bacterium]|nr:HNH endonuclease [Chloroflexota bacterium]